MIRSSEPLSGSDADFVAFVAEVWPRYTRLARLLVEDAHRGEELLQDCLVKLYPRWRGVARRGDPSGYLRQMLLNGSVSWWRRTRREHLVEAPPEVASQESAAAEHRDELRRALLMLPRRQRAVVVLRHYEDLTERETAEALGCSVGTVKSQNAKALSRLRQLLGEHRNEEKVASR